MTDLKRTTQTGGGQSGMTPPGEEGEHNQGAEFGTAERGTRGTDRDANRTGQSKNLGHSHPREEGGLKRD